MKKNQIVSLLLGSAAVAAGAAWYAAQKIAGESARPKHDPKDQIVNTPYVPEEDDLEEPEEPVEAVQDEGPSAVPDAGTVAVPDGGSAAEPSAEEVLMKDGDDVAGAEEAPEDAAEAGTEVAPEDAAEAWTEEAPEDAAEAEAEEAPEEQKPYDLEEYMELHPEERASMESLKESFAADGVRTDVSFAGNTMFFDFVMTDVEDDETKEFLKPDLMKFLDDQAETYKNTVRQIEEDTGIEGVRMIVIFMDENEAEIVSGHYDREGRTI